MAHSRILIVEDDPEQAKLYASVLSTSGYEVVTFGNAEDALTALEDKMFALALVDWDRPGMPGDVLILTLKTQYPDVKTILFSNHNEVDRMAISSGADAWMLKTEGILRLREMVNELLQSV